MTPGGGTEAIPERADATVTPTRDAVRRLPGSRPTTLTTYEFTPIVGDASWDSPEPWDAVPSARAIALSIPLPPLGLWLLWTRRPRHRILLAATLAGLAGWALVALLAFNQLSGTSPATMPGQLAGIAAVPTPAAPAPTLPPPTVPAPAPVTAPPPTSIVTAPTTVRRGDATRLVASTQSGAQCSITITYSFGPSTAVGLAPAAADASGKVEWNWTVARTVPAGTWPIHVDCGSAGSADASFAVS